jgi:hypothetical protein
MDRFSFGLHIIYVEVQEKQDVLWGILRTLESDDRRVLVKNIRRSKNILTAISSPIDILSYGLGR